MRFPSTKISLNVLQTLKMKSSHDVLQDPKLSSQPVVETAASVQKV